MNIKKADKSETKHASTKQSHAKQNAKRKQILSQPVFAKQHSEPRPAKKNYLIVQRNLTMI